MSQLASALLTRGVVIANLLQELRLSARSLSRTPVLTGALIVSIALGIASNASVGGFAHALVAQDQPFPAEAIAGIRRLLQTTAAGVFAIACANVAAFLLARATARSRETAVRVAIGAGRRQLVHQALADSVLIAGAGAIGGGVLAYWLRRIVPALLFDQDAAQMRFAADVSGVALIAAGGAVITIGCGLLPLIEMRHDDPAAIMQRETAGPSRASRRIGAGLVVAQMTACTLLIVSAGLVLAGYRSSLQTSTGRRLSNAVIASVDALQTSSKATQAANAASYFADTERVARDVTGATNVAWAGIVPGDRPVMRSFRFERSGLRLRAMTFQRQLFTARGVDQVLLPPLKGRMFATVDAGPCGGVVLSEEAARQAGTTAIVGRSIETPSGWSDVIGVVRLQDDAQDAVVFHYAPTADPSPAGPAVYRVPEFDEAPPTDLDVNVVSRNYFDTLGLRIIAGRAFDGQRDQCRVGIVNEEASERYFDGDAVDGALIDVNGVRTRIIGVAASAKIRAAQRDILPTVYLPMDQDVQPRMTMILETSGVSGATLRRLHQQLEQVRGGRPERIIVTTLERHLSRTAFAAERITTVLVGASAAIALSLGLLGLYGVMSDATRRRQREFALRIALGAQGRHMIGQVVAEGMRLVIAGTVMGSVGSFIVAGWIARVAPAADGPSPLVWIIGPCILAVAVGIASILPARRAMDTDPLLMLRAE